MKYSVAIVMLFSAASAFAAPGGDLSAYFDDQIMSAKNAVAACELTPSEDAFALKKFEIGITAQVSFKVGELFNLSVSPEIDFSFGD